MAQGGAAGRRARRARQRWALATWLLTGCGASTTPTAADPRCPNDLPSGCSAAPPSYLTEVAPIVTQRCLSCHGPPDGIQYPKIDLSSQAALAARRGTVLFVLSRCSMPPAATPQPSAAERQILLRYLVCGAPAN